MFEYILLTVSVVSFLCSIYDITVSYVPKPLLCLYIINMVIMLGLVIKIIVF